jgi:hypothetical protein
MEKAQVNDPITVEVVEAIETAVSNAKGSTVPIKPSHRIPFHWPPHAISLDFHVLASDWTGRESFELDGETFEAAIAKTPFGVFARCQRHWNEAKADSVENALEGLKAGLEPLFARQRAIAHCLGEEGRCSEEIRSHSRPQLVRLLYCEDRDVAAEAQREIETQASSGLFTQALIHILNDRRHPNRRSAQWCVLDMMEDIDAFCRSESDVSEAIDAIRGLIWTAGDDYARTIYKAGVVLGGHICNKQAAEALIDCIEAPSRIGRRSAMHAVFHLNEWMPETKPRIVAALQKAADEDPEPLLRTFAACMAEDIASDKTDHVTEPMFPEEAD